MSFLRPVVFPTVVSILTVLSQSSVKGADGPPVLTVLAPVNHTVARSASIYVEAAATDDVSPNCTIKIYDGTISAGSLQLTGTNTVKGYVASAGTLLFQATDDMGQETLAVRKFLIEPNSNLVEVATAPGLVFDFDPDRFLCAISPDPGSYTGAVARLGEAEAVIVDRHSGSQTVISDIVGSQPDPIQGVLSSNGAFVVFRDYSAGTWNSGVWTDYGLGFQSLAGRLAFIKPATPPFRFVVRDIDNPANQCTVPAIHGCCSSYTFAANGDILFASDFVIYRNRANDPANPFGARDTTALTYNGAGPLTDGTNIVFWFPGAGMGLLTPTGQEVLSTNTGEGTYRINNGWVVFARRDEAGHKRIWVRSPDGQIEPRITPGSSNLLESLGPTGSLTFTDLSTPQRRYFSRAGAPAWDIGALQGTPKWLPSGELRIMLGRSIFGVGSGHFRVHHQTNATIVAELSGPTGHHLELQSSSNLVSWSPVTTFSNISGTVLFTNNATDARQFFRARLLP